MSKAVLVNYNFSPTWLFDYPDIDYMIYDRSDSKEFLKDFPQDRIRYTKNEGNVDYDKLGFLVDFYDNLPDVFLWGKTNLFKYIEHEEFDKVRNNSVFTPLLSLNHKTYRDKYSDVCFYRDGMYFERNDSWYVNELPSKIGSYSEFTNLLHIPCPVYIPFAPGGNYILTKERVHRYGRDFYDEMRSLLPYAQNPAEAHMCERSYFTLWQ